VVHAAPAIEGDICVSISGFARNAEENNPTVAQTSINLKRKYLAHNCNHSYNWRGADAIQMEPYLG
jgi:hypothetical protein